MGILEGKHRYFVQSCTRKILLKEVQVSYSYLLIYYFLDEHVLFELVQYSDVYKGE